MTREFRSFEFEGVPHRLAGGDDVRAADIRAGTLTLTREGHGEPRVIRARDLNVPLPGAVAPPSPERLYDFRLLVEQALELDFTDDEIIEILEIARRHRLLREPASAEGGE